MIAKQSWLNRSFVLVNHDGYNYFLAHNTNSKSEMDVRMIENNSLRRSIVGLMKDIHYLIKSWIDYSHPGRHC